MKIKILERIYNGTFKKKKKKSKQHNGLKKKKKVLREKIPMAI